jgi:AAA family ATP:ADP antiporter
MTAGVTALVMVAVPLAVTWAALGLWLGRAQQRQAGRRRAPAPVTTPVREGVAAL